MNLKIKKEVYEVIMFFWSELKKYVFTDSKPDFDGYLNSVQNEYDIYKQKDSDLFELFSRIAADINHYLYKKGL